MSSYAYQKKLNDYNYAGLPDKTYFQNELGRKKMCDISDEDYNHARLIYCRLGCKSFLDFHKIYLALDVVLLANVFKVLKK